MKKRLVVLALAVSLSACGGGGSTEGDGDVTDVTNDHSDDVDTDSPEPSSNVATDITDAIFTRQVANCAEYVDQYSSSVRDIGNNTLFDGRLSVTVADGKCAFEANAIPNHDFNDGQADFATPVAEQDDHYTITENPTIASVATPLSLELDNAIFLNGVKLDLLAAACYGVGPDPLGREKIGCNDVNQPFRYDPMSPLNNFGTDSHHAHTQPDGTYHYHGSPNAMFYSDAAIESPVIGFAADGFPIYGSYFNDNGTIRKVVSSYRLKSGTRENVVYKGVTYSPGGSYDGRYIDDFEYVEGLGDLDECNGMSIAGHYGYYVTDAYPWILNCYRGSPDASFSKR